VILRHVLITGGTSGIGYELAKIFAMHGFEVILVSSSKERLIAAQKKLEQKFQTNIFIYVQGLSEVGSAKRLYNRIQATGITVDILINNAGYGLVGQTEGMRCSPT